MDTESPAEYLNPIQRFGFEVRQVRQGRKITQTQLGRGTGYTVSYVSKVEAGKVTPSLKFARGCDHVFGTHGLFERLHPKADGDHPSWFEPYVDLEREATVLLDYSSMLFMGMLQTPEYARAVIRAVNPHKEPREIETMVDARMGRRNVIERKNPPLLWAVLHEACLRTDVGGPRVMRDQLNHLMQIIELPNVTMQVLAFKSGAPPAHLPFTLLKRTGGSVMLYSETQYRGHVADSEAAVTEAEATFDRLRAVALSPDSSLALIYRTMEESTP